MSALALTSEEQAMASGQEGPAREFAMHLMSKAATILGARSLQPIEAAHINAPFAMVETNLDMLEWLVETGAKVKVPTFTNIAIDDPGNPALRAEPGDIPVVQRSQLTRRLVQQIGCELSLTCAPYFLPKTPGLGAHVASGESNAVVYYNSVLGVRTAKYGDYLDLAAALTGRVPLFGLHTDAGRRAVVQFDIEPTSKELMSEQLGYHLIGHAVGRRAGLRVPVLTGLPSATTSIDLRALGACAASAGSVAMFHAVGLTPEAPTLASALQNMPPVERIRIGPAEIKAALAELTHFDSGPIDAVVVGTPHAALDEVEALVTFLRDRRVASNVVFYIQMGRFVFECARHKGWVDVLRNAGVTPVVDTCIYWRPVVAGLKGKVLSNSGKFAYYAPGELKVEAAIGSLRECVESAIAGRVWRDPRLLSDR